MESFGVGEMSGYLKAEQLGLTTAIVPGSNPERGYTDAEIVAILQTLTTSDIAVDALASLLREEGLLLWTGERYVGSIQNLAVAQSNNLQLIAGIDELKSSVFGQSAKKLRTTEPKWAGKVWAIVSAIVALIPDTEGIVDKVYDLDGGRPYKTLTAEQFAAQRTAATAIASKTDALDLVTNEACSAARTEYRKADSTPESIIAAAMAVLEVG